MRQNQDGKVHHKLHKTKLAAAIVSAAIFGASPMTSANEPDLTAQNIAVLRDWTERANHGDIKHAIDTFALNTRNFGEPVGREGVRHVLEDIYATFPDMQSKIIEIVAVGDSVIIRYSVSGTHKGVGKLPVNSGMLVGVAPTQKHFEVQHIHWFKMKDGKIADHYATRDDIGMMQQLGLLPLIARPDTK